MDSSKENFFSLTVLILLVWFLVLFGRLFYLQVIKGSEYELISSRIRARVITKLAPRGNIYDRYGQIMARSKSVYDLYLLPYQLVNPDQTFDFLQKINIDVKQAKKYYQQNKTLNFDSILILKNLNKIQLSYLEENRQKHPEIMIQTRIVRDYPHGKTCSHALGYVGEINAQELSRLKSFGYKLGDIVGMTGIERYYDSYLKGINGGQPLEVDPMGKPVRSLLAYEPVAGSDLYLSIDLELQECAEKAFGENKGALVAVNPNTGEILAMLSRPNFDPNYFTDVISDKEWQEINNKDHPLHNRALTGYPAGSTFKIVTSLAALEESTFNPERYYFCPGFLKLNGKRFNCWISSGHGRLNFYQGFVKSCNVVFYNLGMQLGCKKIAKAAAKLGLGLSTNIDLPFESKGLIPTEKWKQKNYHEDWYPGDNLNLAIGQGYVLVTPLQMAMAVAAIANTNNILLKPFLVKKIVSPEKKDILTKEQEPVGLLQFNPKNIVLLRELMRQVVLKGTGQNANIENFPVCGKTGTAERGKEKDHAWFVSYGPEKNPELALAVFVEGGGHGGVTAALISREIYIWWQQNRSGLVPDPKEKK